ncbi:MAG: hypothetical protein H7318_19430 [Oligoflexus sp.]|nr:hypothetical protein [Oligoflexus sp.]
MLRHLSLVCLLSLSSSCAVLHKVQLSDLSAGKKTTPISIRVSESTVDFGELSTLAGAVGKSNPRFKGTDDALSTYKALFQFGPRTGTPVFNDAYAHLIPEALAAKCPKGYLSDITSVRETRSYPIIKGEIVRVDALCNSKE